VVERIIRYELSFDADGKTFITEPLEVADETE